jgi:hypothetical protein
MVDIGTMYGGNVITIRINTTIVCRPPANEQYNHAVVTTSGDSDARDNMTTVQFIIDEPTATPTPTPSPSPTPLPLPTLPTDVPVILPPTGR